MKTNGKINQRITLLVAFLVFFQQLCFAVDESYELFTPLGASNIQWYADTTGTGVFVALPGEVNNSIIVETAGVYYAVFNFADCNNATAYFVLVEEGSILEYPVTIMATPDADSYQWFDDLGAISEKTTSTYAVAEEGEYYVKTKKGYCQSESPLFLVQTLYKNKPPVAADDQESGDVNVPVTSTVIFNDTDPEGDDLTVDTVPVLGPSYGTLTLNEDGSYTYTPTEAFTGSDKFVYRIYDTKELYDTAIVYINIDCPSFNINDIFIPQLVTPNGDGKNDVWKVADLKLLMNCYESNEVMIFNRWEEKVFEKNNYGMDDQWWDGYSTNSLDVKNNELVPTGTYFYYIILDGDEKNALTGFIHLQW